MTVSMLIRNSDTGECEDVPVACSDTFRRVWLPAAENLGLELVALFDGGALTTVPPELVPQIIAEVTCLQQWAPNQPNGEYLVERCTDILAAFARTDPTVCEYNFG